MLPNISSDNDEDIRSGTKISTDIIVIFTILVAMIILPPFIIASTVFYRNRRKRVIKPMSISGPIISNPITNPNLGHRHGSSNPPPLASIPTPAQPIPLPDIFKPLPPLPPAIVLTSPTLASHTYTPPSHIFPTSLPTLSKHRTTNRPQLPANPNRHTWRTSNPPHHPLPQQKHKPTHSLISLTSSTDDFTNIDLSDDIPISPLSTASRWSRIANVGVDPAADEESKSGAEWEVRPLGTRVLKGKSTDGAGGMVKENRNSGELWFTPVPNRTWVGSS